MADSEFGILFGYVLFIGLLGLFADWGSGYILNNAPVRPAAPPNGCWVCFLTFPVFQLAYFILLVGVTAIAYPWLGALLTAYSVVVLYMIIRIFRGGG